MNSRLLALDGLRGYAAIIVVFFHAILIVDASLMEVFKKPIYALNHIPDFLSKIALIIFNGHAAVDLFFVLSGAILIRWLQQCEVKRPARMFTDFAIQRFFRIYPALVVSLLLIYLLSNGLNYRFPNIFHTYFSTEQFWQNFFLYKITLHGASWTLQVEMLAIPLVFLAFYLFNKDLVSPVNFFAFFRQPPYLGWILVCLCVYGIAFGYFQRVGLIGFCLGFFVLLPRMKPIFCSMNPNFIFVFLGLAFSIKHFFSPEAGVAISVFRRLIQGFCVFSAIGLLYYNERGIFVKWMKHSISQYLGRVSYSLYLLNVVGLRPIITIGRHYFPEFCLHHPLLVGLLLGVGLTLLTLPVAHLVYHYIEKPGIKLGRRIINSDGLRAQTT